ncbi:MAG: hypothetical protein WD043_12445 [Gemmatimonadales bacterium]
MSESIDWRLATWDGLRRQQAREYRALPLRDKVALLEHMGELTAYWAERRRAREQNRTAGTMNSVPGQQHPG